MKKRKISLVAALAAAAMVTTSMTAYAFWNAGYNGANAAADPAVVEIGEGEVVNTTLALSEVLSSGSDLVPTSVTAQPGQVQAVVFAVNVKWTSVGNGSLISGVEAPLAIALSDIKIGNDSLEDADKGLFNLAYSETTVVGDNAAGADATITITMNEPADEAQYGRVAGKDLAFTFTFSVDGTTQD